MKKLAYLSTSNVEEREVLEISCMLATLNNIKLQGGGVGWPVQDVKINFDFLKIDFLKIPITVSKEWIKYLIWMINP